MCTRRAAHQSQEPGPTSLAQTHKSMGHDARTRTMRSRHHTHRPRPPADPRRALRARASTRPPRCRAPPRAHQSARRHSSRLPPAGAANRQLPARHLSNGGSSARVSRESERAGVRGTRSIARPTRRMGARTTMRTSPNAAAARRAAAASPSVIQINPARTRVGESNRRAVSPGLGEIKARDGSFAVPGSALAAVRTSTHED